MKKRGKNLDELDEVVRTLARREVLDDRYRDHALIGKFTGMRECHVEPDLLLVYRIENEQLVLYLLRLGTHADIFE